jgi:hypothetical protein
MRLPRAPYPLLILWTVVALLPIPWLVGAMTAPIILGCFEWCDLGQQFAALGFRLVSVLWLLVVLIVAWSWRAREPTVAAVSAVVAGPLLLLVALRFYVVTSEVITEDLLYLAWVLSLGLQLPPVWRLSQRRSPSTPLRMVVGVMNLAVAVAACALVFLGTSVPWSAGPNVVFVCWVAFVGCLILISVAAWRDDAAAVSLVGPLLAASLPILLVPPAIIVPGDIAYAVFLIFPLSALAWLWIATSWLRERKTPLSADGQLAFADRIE